MSEVLIVNQILSLNRNKIAGQYAPHKPILLLAIMDLYEAGLIEGPIIRLTDTLKSAFQENWQTYVGRSFYFRPKITTPFWHLNSEPFWQLKDMFGNDVNLQDRVYSEKSLRNGYYAVLDETLAAMMTNPNWRTALRGLLIANYLQVQPNNTSETLLSITLLLPILLSFAS